MNSTEIRGEAQRLLAELAEREETDRLAPFGDGPTEAIIADRLVKNFPDQHTRERIISDALSICTRSILSTDEPTKPAHRLAELAFVARFAKASLPTGLIDFVVSQLIQLKSPVAIEAASDLIRTIARRGGGSEILANLDLEDNDELRLSAAELLARNNDPRAIPLLIAVPNSAALDQLFWALVQSDGFVALLSADTQINTCLTYKIKDGLTRVDTSGLAVKEFERRISLLRSNYATTFAAMDYRLTAMADEEEFA